MQRVPDFLSLVWDAELLQLMLLACPDGVIVADTEGRVILYTGASERIFGYSPIEVLNKDATMLFGDPAAYRAFIARIQVEGAIANLEIPGQHKDTGPFVSAVSGALCRDRWGAIIGFVLYIRDHSGMRAIEDALRDNNDRLNELVDKLHHVANHDSLTGLLNRGSAFQAAERALSVNPREPLGVVVLDVDHFKLVNDTYGHLNGDDVLRSLALVLRSVARSSDIVGRFGGEEFVAFLPGANVDAARLFAERVREAVATAAVQAGATEIRITISAGVAAIAPGSRDLNDALRVADDRLFLAKRAGRNRVVSTDLEPQRNAA